MKKKSASIRIARTCGIKGSFRCGVPPRCFRSVHRVHRRSATRRVTNKRMTQLSRKQRVRTCAKCNGESRRLRRERLKWLSLFSPVLPPGVAPLDNFISPRESLARVLSYESRGRRRATAMAREETFPRAARPGSPS